MITIAPKHFNDNTINRVRINEHVTDASSLEFAPGEWPKLLHVTEGVGNGMPYVLKLHDYVANGVTRGEYVQDLGVAVLHVYND